MRKILCLFMMLVMFCLVSSGGCGSSSSNSGGGDTEPAVNVEWTEASGKWKPDEGSTITYYNSSNNVSAVYTLNADSSDSTDITVSGASGLYNVELGDGTISFSYASGSRSRGGVLEYHYGSYNVNGGYSVSGNTLVRSDNDDDGTLSKTFYYEDISRAKAVLVREDGGRTVMKAEITFSRIED